MHEPLLAQAALPAPTIVCGLLLRPYSLGHELWLIRDSHAPASHPLSTCFPSDPEGLKTAVYICASTWDELNALSATWTLRLKTFLWDRRTRHVDWLREAAKFAAYVAAGSVEFPISEIARPDRASAPRVPGTPFLLRLHAWLMTHLRLSEGAAWDYPIALAKMRWAAYWEQEAGLDVYNAHDAEFDLFVAEQEEKRANAKRPMPRPTR